MLRAVLGRIAYVLFSLVVGVIMLGLAAAVIMIVPKLLGGGLGDGAAQNIGYQAAKFGFGFGGAAGAALGAWIGQESAKSEDAKKANPIGWGFAVALGLYCLYRFFTSP
jgi:hypothetical protein